MRELFWGFFSIWETIRSMSGQIGAVILIVLICRLFVGRISKQASYLLWLVVAVRLLCPVMISSEFSIFNWIDEKHLVKDVVQKENTVETVTNIYGDEITIVENVFIDSGRKEAVLGESFSGAESSFAAEDVPLATIKKNIFWMYWDFFFWMAGMMLMIAYGIFSYWHLKRKLRFATKIEENVFECERISSPFVFGILNPRIYLPYHLEEQEKKSILLHENYHIKRYDYLVKIAAFLLLTVYWFHPFVWAAFYLMERDMELSCDEQVLRDMDLEERKAYSRVLLNFAKEKPYSLTAPFSFGENVAKSRIKRILNYKKPTFWGILAVTIVMLIVSVCCLTDAKEEKDSNEDVDVAETDKAVIAQELYKAKNPYIGDISANGKLLSLLWSYYEITGSNGTELQTSAAPYWITITFDEKPDDIVMWKAAAVFLALVENCSEFRWEFLDESGRLMTYYVREEDFNESLGSGNLKAYGDSPEHMADLLKALEEKKTDETKLLGDTETEMSVLLSYSSLSDIAKKKEISWDVVNRLESKLIADGIDYRSDKCRVRDLVCEDFDNSGQMDFAVLISDESWEDNVESFLYIYMNEDAVYTENLPIYSWSLGLTAGDIDWDGNTELVYCNYTGGNGGAGSYCKGILKYENHNLFPIEVPGDYTEEERSFGEAGYHVEVAFGKDLNTYKISCPAIGEIRTLDMKYLKNEDGSDYVKNPAAGQVIGAECRGYYAFGVIEENGKDYLVGREYLFGEGGIVHGIAYAEFRFEWGKNGWNVNSFHVYKL